MITIVCNYCYNDFAIEMILAKGMDKAFCPYCKGESRLKDGIILIDKAHPENDPTSKGFIIRSKE